jgi:hypothetical protein
MPAAWDLVAQETLASGSSIPEHLHAMAQAFGLK